jgi:serine---pyruvate transaminase
VFLKHKHRSSHATVRAGGDFVFQEHKASSSAHGTLPRMAQKRYLFTPGPTPVPPQVLAALAEPVLHHRAPDFREVYARVLARLQEVHRTRNDVLLFTCSGTGAFESAIVNLCSPGERVLAVSAGSFGERWATMAKTFGCEVEELRYPWGETPTAEDLRRKLDKIEPVSLVFLVHSETSTGVVADVQALGAVAKEAGALVVVDAVSSLAAVPLEMDEWGLDVVVSGSQKALMTPPGLATAAVSPAAWEQVRRSTLPRFYFDWQKMRAAQEKLDSAFTPAVSLVVALDVALGLLLDDGLDAAFERHIRLGRACRAGIKAMGLELFSPDEDRAAVVTAARIPDGIDATDLTQSLRDRHGVTIAGGQGELKGQIFRIGHIGWYDEFDVATALSAVELVLGELGAQIERGIAATRALEVYAEGAAV